MPLLNLPVSLRKNLRASGVRETMQDAAPDTLRDTMRNLLRRETDGSETNGFSGGGAQRLAVPDTRATGRELVWSRNLSWVQREQSARQRRANGDLSLEPEAGFELAGTPRGIASKDSSVAGNLLFATCMNPQCETNWLRLWRRRQAPRLEGQWACSPECMRVFVDQAVARELAGDMPWGPQPHRHRMPLGLILLAQGWVTEAQLRAALDAQRTVGKGRIGTWLMRQCKLPEERVTRALGMQWGCPVLSVANHQPEATATLIPRLLLDNFGLLPVRVASRRILYLGFEDRIDAAAALAVGRMTGLRVETGVVAATQYLHAHERMMAASFPKAVLTEASTANAVANILTEAIERVRPYEARLVRMHQYLWFRMWRTPLASPPAGSQREASPGSSVAVSTPAVAIPRLHQVEDLLCRYVPEGTQE